jgi:hypothetical protein
VATGSGAWEAPLVAASAQFHFNSSFPLGGLGGGRVRAKLNTNPFCWTAAHGGDTSGFAAQKIVFICPWCLQGFSVTDFLNALEELVERERRQEGGQQQQQQQEQQQ